MIISHKHKFIFVKTLKTAGTSIELALSKYCGPEDVITFLGEEDAERSELGYRGPQNFHVPFGRYGLRDWLYQFRKLKHQRFREHDPGAFIRDHIDAEIWRSYFKFAIERNPWEKFVSAYYFYRSRLGGTTSDADMSEWLNSGTAAEWMQGRNMYSDGDRVIVDRIYRYEELTDAMRDLAERVGLPEAPTLPRAKSRIRKDKRHYSKILSEPDLKLIERIYAWEIETFGYELERQVGDSNGGRSQRVETAAVA